MKQDIQNLIMQKTVFLSLKGQLNPHNAITFKKNIFNIPEEKTFLILDLTNLNSISGDGIKVFYESLKYFQKRQGKIIIIQPKEEIFLLLKFLKLLNYVIIVESYLNAKEIIENIIKNDDNSGDFCVEKKEIDEMFIEQVESNTPHERNIIAKNADYYSRIIKYNEPVELKTIKENLNLVQQQLSKIQNKLQMQDQDNLPENQNILNYIEEKIKEIKKSNESYFQEFHIRMDSINDSHQQLKESVHHLKIEIQELKNLLQENQQKVNQQENQLNFQKNLDGFFIFECKNCNQPLRVKQFGKHICPKCKTIFNVLPEGVIKFYEHS